MDTEAGTLPKHRRPASQSSSIVPHQQVAPDQAMRHLVVMLEPAVGGTSGLGESGAGSGGAPLTTHRDSNPMASAASTAIPATRELWSERLKRIPGQSTTSLFPMDHWLLC